MDYRFPVLSILGILAIGVVGYFTFSFMFITPEFTVEFDNEDIFSPAQDHLNIEGLEEGEHTLYAINQNGERVEIDSQVVGEDGEMVVENYMLNPDTREFEDFGFEHIIEKPDGEEQSFDLAYGLQTYAFDTFDYDNFEPNMNLLGEPGDRAGSPSDSDDNRGKYWIGDYNTDHFQISFDEEEERRYLRHDTTGIVSDEYYNPMYYPEIPINGVYYFDIKYWDHGTLEALFYDGDGELIEIVDMDDDSNQYGHVNLEAGQYWIYIDETDQVNMENLETGEEAQVHSLSTDDVETWQFRQRPSRGNDGTMELWEWSGLHQDTMDFVESPSTFSWNETATMDYVEHSYYEGDVEETIVQYRHDDDEVWREDPEYDEITSLNFRNSEPGRIQSQFLKVIPPISEPDIENLNPDNETLMTTGDKTRFGLSFEFESQAEGEYRVYANDELVTEDEFVEGSQKEIETEADFGLGNQEWTVEVETDYHLSEKSAEFETERISTIGMFTEQATSPIGMILFILLATGGAIATYTRFL